MKRQFRRYLDSEGITHAGGTHIAVNSGLCGNNDWIDDVDDAVDCTVCIAVDQYVRAHRALATPTDQVKDAKGGGA